MSMSNDTEKQEWAAANQLGPNSIPEPSESSDGGASFWIYPVRSLGEESAQEVVKTLVAKEGIFAFGERTPGRKHLKPGDWICFYATGSGVVAHAKVLSYPERKSHPRVGYLWDYPWVFALGEANLYLNDPVVIDGRVRAWLDSFKNRDPNRAWAWFVHSTRRISRHDFEILTRNRC